MFTLEGLQMVAPPSVGAVHGARTRPEWHGGVEAVRLSAQDVPEMLDLAARTRPGPLWPRTHELGTYLGIRERGALIAMAGERLRPRGWTEVSAVCTAPQARGRGYAATLVQSLMSGITARASVTFSGFRTPVTL